MKNNKNTFDWTKWNTKIIHCPNELLEKLNMLNFIGKKVSNIFFVGIVFLDDEEDLNEKELYYFSIDEPNKTMFSYIKHFFQNLYKFILIINS